MPTGEASKKNTLPPLLVVTIALPAVVWALNEVVPLLLIVELAAVAVELPIPESPNCRKPPLSFVIVAVPALVAAVNSVVPPAWVVMVAFPAGAVSVPKMGTPNWVAAPLLVAVVVFARRG